MQALTVTEEVVLNTSRFFRRYPSVPAGTEADVDKILVDVYGEARLLGETLKKKAETRGESVAIETTNDGEEKPTGVLFSREENIVAWPHCPARLGRVSSKFVGEGLYTHEEAEVLPAQLKMLQEQKPTKQHFRFAVVNGFGSNLGDNTIGITAFRVIAECLEQHFKSFSVDILFGPDTNPANADIVGYEPWVDQVLFQGPTLVEFAQYDAYFDVSGLITLPKFDEMPTVDWYLWWFGLDPKLVPAEKKRNKGHIRWDAWNAVHALLKDIPGKKVLFNPKASVPLRSMPAEVAIKFAKRLLELDPEMKLVCAQPLELKHKRFINLYGQLDSTENFKALIAHMDGVITVDTFTTHQADICAIPTVTLFSSIPPSAYPYYPFNEGFGIPGYKNLPAYKRPKVSEEEWIEISNIYLHAWELTAPEEIIILLNSKIGERMTANSAQVSSLQLISSSQAKTCVENFKGTAKLKRQCISSEFEHSHNRLSSLAKSVLKPGAMCVLAGAGVPTLALSLAQQVGNQGRLQIFEPRRILGQLLSGSLVQAGLFNAAVDDRLPVGGVKQANFPDLTPWSESSVEEWGNCRSAVTVNAYAIDELNLNYCQALIIQPPMPFAKVVEGALDTLKKCRPLILISPISQDDAGLACKAALSANYTFWAEPALVGGDMSRMLLLGIPSEQDMEIKGFIKIELE